MQAPAAPSRASDGEIANQSTCGRAMAAIDIRSTARRVIAAGQAERKSRQSDERNEDDAARPAAGRARPRDTDGPGRPCSTAEIIRSTYIAASTIATAPDGSVAPPCLEHAGQDRGTRPRRPSIRGTASAITPDRHQHRRQRRPPARHAAELRELARSAGPPLDRAGEQEQDGRDQPVVDHLENGAVDSEVVGREQAERDQTELGHRRVRDHAADVGRTEGEQRAVDEPDRREHEDRRAEVVHGRREEREADPQEPEHGRLRDHAREHGRDLRRRLAIGVRQPAVEREERRLDDEGGREAQEDPVARRASRRRSSRTSPPGARRRSPPRASAASRPSCR